MNDQHKTREQLLAELQMCRALVAEAERQERERKVMEETLRQSEERLKYALESAEEGLWDWNLVTGNLFTSPRWSTMLGYEPGEIAPHITGWEPLCHPDDLPEVMYRLEEHFAGRSPAYEFEHRLKHKGGGWVWILGRAKVVQRDETGRPVRIVGTNVDISARKRAEEALRESEERWLFALEGSGQGVWDWEATTNSAFFSTRWKEMFGYSEDEIGDCLDEWTARIHPEDQEDAIGSLRQHLAGATATYISEHRLRRKDGDYTWVVARGKVMARDADGQPIRFVGTHTDISERKQAETAIYRLTEELEQRVRERTAELEASKHYFQRVADLTPVIVYVYDLLEQRNTYANREIAAMLGYTPEEVQAMGLAFLARVMHPDDFALVPARIAHLASLGDTKVDAWEYRMRHADGDWRWIAGRESIFARNADGQPTQVLGTALDITVQKQAEAALRASEETLRHLNADLERRVSVRTAELEAVNARLERELAQRQRAEATLREQTRLTTALFEHAPVAIQIFDRDGYSLRMNEANRKLLDLPTVDYGVGQFNILTDPIQVALGLDQPFRRAYAGEVVTQFERHVELDHPENNWLTDHRSFWYNQVVFPLRDDDGAVVAVVGFTEDITVQQEARQSLARMTNLLDGLFRYAPLGLQIFDRDGVSLRMNEAQRRFLGVPDVTYGVGTFNALTDPFMIASGSAASYAQAYAGDVVWLPEFQLTFNDPTNTWLTEKQMVFFDQVLFPIQGADGAVEGVVSCLLDVTARKENEAEIQRLNRELEQLVLHRTEQLQATVEELTFEIAQRQRVEATLRESQHYLQRIADQTPVVIYVYDLVEQRNVYANRELAEVLGYTMAETQAIGAPLLAYIVHPDDFAALPANLRQIAALHEGETFEWEYRIRHRNGEWHWLYTRDSVFARDADGRPTQILGTAMDITERKRAEEAVRKLNEDLEERVRQRTLQLEAANKELESFSYSVSHDLRTPLRAIDGFSRALLEDYATTLNAEGQHYLQRICAATQRMGQLIDDLLNLSRVTRAEMHRAEVDLTRLAQTIAAELQQTNPERAVIFAITPGVSACGDEYLLHIVLDNLFANAWKFTSHHQTARIEFGVTGENGSRAYFIRDDGAGFDMAYAGKLFGAFQRLHNLNEFPGTGIGLATVQRIIHRHGGCVWAEASVEQGATFYFTLPA